MQPDFEWVEVVNSCVISSAFEQLKLQVSSDVAKRNAQLSKQKAGYSIRFLGNGSSFAVAIEATGVSGRAVKFELTANSILVANAKDERIFEATLTLSDFGECKYLIEGQEKESWQLRKRALQELFFRSPWERQI